ncbi:MAG TPA: DUF3592 domain-containing protein [Candidatus Limnocylindrales bacterium]|nr:DUF3592 domain-containing protein [Candidatus Limnocylindrales bacterium]
MPDVGGMLQGTLMTTVIILVVVGILTVAIIFFAMRYVRSMSGGGKDAQRIAANGVAGQGRILGVRQTGTYINNNPVADIMLEIHPANGQPPYQTTVRRTVSLFQISQFQQGSVLPVKFDPADPSQVVLLV